MAPPLPKGFPMQQWHYQQQRPGDTTREPIQGEFNVAGIARRIGFRDSLRTKRPTGVPSGILTPRHFPDPGVERRGPGADVRHHFLAAQYLNEHFAAAGLQNVERGCGLWAWLALFYAIDPPTWKGC